MWEESKHPRDNDGKFTDGNCKNTSYTEQVNERINFAKENNIELPLLTDGSIDDLKLQQIIKDYINENSFSNDINVIYGKEFKGYKGQEAINKLLQEKQGHVKGAFFREDIGSIDLLWGNDDLGLQHIIKRREEQRINTNDFLNNIAEVVDKGKVRCKNSRGNFEILYNNKLVVISPEYHNQKVTFLLTAYKTRYK